MKVSVKRSFATITKPLHVSTASAVGGRAGHTKNSDGVVDVKLSLPTSLGGKGIAAGTTTPEDLFAAGYAACFGGAAELVAKNVVKVNPSRVAIEASVTLGRAADNSLALSVTLTGTFGGITQDEAQKVMEAAHKVCPYSNATRNNVDVTLKSVVTKQ